jgi:hypothetical protein
VHLGTDTVDEFLGTVRALDEGYQSLNLGVVGVEVVVINVELRSAISSTGSLEGDADEGLIGTKIGEIWSDR